MPPSLSSDWAGPGREALRWSPLILLLQTPRTRAWCNPTPTLICNLSGCLPGWRPGLVLGQVQEGKSSGRDLCKQLSSGKEEKQVGQVRRETAKLLRFPARKKGQGAYSSPGSKPQRYLSVSVSLHVSVSHSPSLCLSSPAFYVHPQSHTAVLFF